MKILKLLVLLLVNCLVANAQSGYYQPFSVGAGFGVTIAVAGEETLTSANAATFSFNYHINPFTSLSLEAQIGQLTSGDATKDTYGKQFINDYKAFIFHADFQMGSFIDYSRSPFLNGLKNVYGGIGLGVLMNNISAIQLINPADSATPHIYIKDSPNLLIPLRLGYEFKIYNHYDEPQVRLDIGYSFNTAFGPGLDGYTSIYTHSYIKFYNYFSATLKYSFGGTKQYKKQITYTEF